MTIFLILGVLIALFGVIWFLVVAFKESVLWGLGCLIIPFVSLIFLIMNFGKAWRPFALYVLGILVMIPGMIGFAEDAEKIRAQQMVPLPFEQPLTTEESVDVLMKLKNKGIKSTITLGKVYVQKQDVERAVAILAAPEETK